MRINHNLLAINSHRAMTETIGDGAKAMEKLSSGLRINRAGDDAAGLAISEKMRGQIRGLTMASRNSSDTISLIQTAEGALTETHSILQRMRELAVQSANDTNTDDDRKQLNNEIKQLKSEIDRIGNTTEFNTKKLLDGSVKGVAAAVAADVKINNNSGSVIISTGHLADFKQQIADARDIGVFDDDVTAFNGAYMLVRTGSATTDPKGTFVPADYKLVGADGKEYDLGTLGATVTLKAGAGSGGTIAVGTSSVTFTGGASTAKAFSITLGSGSRGGIPTMAVGESLTFIISKYEENSDKLNDSVMAQIGANSGQTMFVSMGDMRARALGVFHVDIATKWGAATAIETVNNALTLVSNQRSALGAIQNRLEHTIKNLDVAAENLQAAESRIRDVDMAKEVMTNTRANILQQAAQAMLAQANQAPQSVLQLLR